MIKKGFKDVPQNGVSVGPVLVISVTILFISLQMGNRRAHYLKYLSSHKRKCFLLPGTSTSSKLSREFFSPLHLGRKSVEMTRKSRKPSQEGPAAVGPTQEQEYGPV